MEHNHEEEIDLSVIIKTFNEAKNIAAAISAAQKAAGNVRFEIIVADSLSTDQTVQIASAYPVRIVQLLDPSHRSCGVGAQLGYQVSRGRYVYLLDGDMECEPGFIDDALNYLESHSDVAGVAGDMMELGHGNYEFEIRRRQFELLAQGGWHGEKKWLDGGGIYRKSALQDVGYITNRNLHAYEEKELGLRLGAAGWRLVRVPLLAVRHRGHVDRSFPLLIKRWKTKYVNGGGDFLRAAFGRPYFFSAARELVQYLIIGGVLLASLLALVTAFWVKWPLALMAAAWGAFFLLSLMKKKQLAAACLNVLYLSFWAAGMLRGLLTPQVDPRTEIPCRILK
jgi:glycosyltransferase involved in cell wall biosynthesis